MLITVFAKGRGGIWHIVLACLLISSLFGVARAQTAYFIDGYHGGVHGHYPSGYTRFIVDALQKHPAWKINLEIEPETWDWVKTNEPAAYAEMQALAADQTAAGRLEFVNPAYAQPYLWNIPGENIIRQFQYGIRKVREHFPGAVFSTYSAEEPCFTSALPGILKSLGYRNASLKCPDTCWGGYVRAFGGEMVNWVGPDGTGMAASPRYGVEALQPGSTWQTIAWNNSAAYLDAARNAGIARPVGMCLQDAGWKNGPWLGDPAARQSEYATWRGYFQSAAQGQPLPDWRLSQEDIQVSLVWGAQVLQRLARQVRLAENHLIQAEKAAVLASVHGGAAYPEEVLAEAWRKLMLAEHHDCWIVPYNGRPGSTWADKVARWTSDALSAGEGVIGQSLLCLSGGNADNNSLGVLNTLASRRRGIACFTLPTGWQGQAARVLDDAGHEVACQLAPANASGRRDLIFQADMPAFGYRTYRYQSAEPPSAKAGASAKSDKDGSVVIETDLYRIVLDPARGGVIRSLQALAIGGREFVDAANERCFNEFRGRISEGEEGRICSSADAPAEARVLENGPVRAVVEVTGKIGKHPFTETITVAQGQRLIDFSLRVDWIGNPSVGSKFGQQERYRQEERRRAFYDDREKLLALFPVNLKGQKIHKNAPFDVTESRLASTFFNSWDEIKNNVILNWLDVESSDGRHGLALLTDHTTAYAHGEDHPPGLVLQYAGMGLWGRRYGISGPTTVRYALVPHDGRWDGAGVSAESAAWNEPLIAAAIAANGKAKAVGKSWLEITHTGWEAAAAIQEGKSILVRLFNASGDDREQPLLLDGAVGKASLIELNGTVREVLRPVKLAGGRTELKFAIPRFGVRTLRIEP